MLKNIFFATIAILALTHCKTNNKQTAASANIDTSYQFRNVNWGMTKEQVKARETERFYKEHSDSLQLVYEIDNFLGKKCALIYYFHNDSLKAAWYLFVLNPLSEKADELYENLKETLMDKYGSPSTDTTMWDGVYENMKPNERRMNDALLTNNVYLLSTWFYQSPGHSLRYIELECENEKNAIKISSLNTDAKYYDKMRTENNKQLKQNF